LRQSFITSCSQFDELRPLWQSLYSPERYTLFQSYEWNRLAAEAFRSRSAPRVTAVEDENGAAIIPACAAEETIYLLGDELFDYRDLLVRGDEEVAALAVRCLSDGGTNLHVTALMGQGANDRWQHLGFATESFVTAPCVRRADADATAFEAQHHRSARLVRKLARAGVTYHQYSGSETALVREIYEKKAQQVIDGKPNLLADASRRDFLIAACGFGACNVFTFETAGSLIAALVTFRDGDIRRFYTIYFDYAWAHFSPGVALLYEVTRNSLAQGLDCDYMTGEQPHKMRFATASVPLFRVNASAAQLAEIASGAKLVAA
jgi:CelD/BcsL family acetyltransferase involved in cellulose biosynthesis